MSPAAALPKADAMVAIVSNEVREGVRISPTATVSERATIGPGTSIWDEAQVREGAVIGRDCVVGKGAYVDAGVSIGARCKLQNAAFVFHGFDLEDGVFLGPGAMLLNDSNPRAVNPDGTLKTSSDWEVAKGLVRGGAAVGGGAILLPGITMGRWALVGSGAVVTRDVPDHGLVYGNPARLVGFACFCARRLELVERGTTEVLMRCRHCLTEVRIPRSTHDMASQSA